MKKIDVKKFNIAQLSAFNVFEANAKEIMSLAHIHFKQGRAVHLSFSLQFEVGRTFFLFWGKFEKCDE